MDIFEEVRNTIRGIKVNDLPVVTEWCSTGCTQLDLAIRGALPGGIPVGRIIQTFGGASTGKTVMASVILGSALRAGKLAFYGDTEYSLEPNFAHLYGLDVEHKNFYWGYSWKKDSEATQPETLEEFFDGYLHGILEKFGDKPKIVVIDSLTALPASIEVKKAMIDQGYGSYRAKIISLGLRKFESQLAHTNTTLFLIDQTRDNVGEIFGESEVTTGGRAPEFYTAVRIYLKTEARIKNTAEKDTGIWVKFQIKKNKVGKPFRDGSFKIDWDYGLDDLHSNLRFLAEYQTKTKKEGMKKTTSVDLNIPDEKKPEEIVKVTKTIKTWIPYIEEHRLETFLQRDVVDAWNEIYKAEDRKPRQWSQTESEQLGKVVNVDGEVVIKGSSKDDKVWDKKKTKDSE